MIDLIFLALLTGFVLSFGFGSVFFALIQTSVDYGYKAGRNIALGVAVGDILLVALAIFGTGFLPNIPNFENYVRIIAATLLFGLGISQFRKTKVKVATTAVKSNVKDLIYFISKGLVLNVVNPVNFLAWVLVSSTLKTYNYSLIEEVLFFSICIGTVFTTETLIAYFADKIRAKLSDRLMISIKYATGVIFIALGTKFLLDYFQS
ncbi:MAG: LysE family translocator [Spirosomaceae bacterium]|nr:LysE family translocator [Spirosomataceae bacterium]